ncbi:uncharacterized protein LOC108839442 [Raphanus sativus]|uniref:Uncharacterized protein LOC108839442 n=1 Tax=Raphanus sativus TaxID=3726 RepID=A0A9W3D8Z7_RAPSA|nr:uncharacterized protein LOC108839442 [Raphanus sativus]
MATSRLARFVSEVAPPQFVTVMRRHRAAKQKLDTIKEEEYKEDCFSGGKMMKMSSNKMTTSHHHHVHSSISAPVSNSGSTSKNFLVDVRSSFSVFEN